MKYRILKNLRKLILITIGAIITGFALSSFLSPNEIIDGGVIGVSMILSNIFKLNLGNMTPIDALNTLYKLQSKLNNRW